MSKVKIIIIAAIVFAVCVVGTLFIINKDRIDPTRIVPASARNGGIGDHVRGNSESNIVIVEYADPGCSHCAQTQPILNKLVADYGDRVAFVTRHFMLGGAYKNSMSAAAAIEAAGKQGLYDEMTDKVFENQATWFYVDASARLATFSGIFQSVGGSDLDRFAADMNSSDVKKKINFDDNLGRNQGVKGTPSFYYNGTKVDDGDMKDEASLRAFLDKILAENGLPTGAREE